MQPIGALKGYNPEVRAFATTELELCRVGFSFDLLTWKALGTKSKIGEVVHLRAGG